MQFPSGSVFRTNSDHQELVFSFVCTQAKYCVLHWISDFLDEILVMRLEEFICEEMLEGNIIDTSVVFNATTISSQPILTTSVKLNITAHHVVSDTPQNVLSLSDLPLGSPSNSRRLAHNLCNARTLVHPQAWHTVQESTWSELSNIKRKRSVPVNNTHIVTTFRK